MSSKVTGNEDCGKQIGLCDETVENWEGEKDRKLH